MKRLYTQCVALVCGILLAGSGCIAAQNAVDIKPTPQQTEWQDLEFGVILHFGTNTFLNREWGDGTASPKVFNPTAFDPDQWMKAIKASGAKYVVMVAWTARPFLYQLGTIKLVLSGSFDGTRQEAYGRADCEPAAAG